MATVNELQQILNDILADKNTNLLPDNLREGVNCLGIDGQYEGGIKLFTSKEEMYADDNAKYEDMAAVYSQSTKNMEVNDEVQYITFPETVVLPTAVTESSYCMLRGYSGDIYFDGELILSATYFRFRGYGSDTYIDVRYDSADGTTYTRTGIVDDVIDCGVLVRCENAEEWNDNFSYFMEIKTNIFEGLYQYSDYRDMEHIRFVPLSSITIAPENRYSVWDGKTFIEIDYSVTALKAMYQKLIADGILRVSTNYFYVFLNGENKVCAAITDAGSSYANYSLVAHYDPDTLKIDQVVGFTNGSYTTQSYGAGKVYELDLSNLTYRQIGTTPESSYILSAEDTPRYYRQYTDVKALLVDVTTDVAYNDFIRYTNEGNNLYGRVTNSTGSYYGGQIIYPIKQKYQIAPTQLTLAEPDELLPNRVALGKNGIVVGDGSIYDNLDMGEACKDATATAGDIIAPKVAYTTQGRVVGNIMPTERSLDVSLYYDSTPTDIPNLTQFDMVNAQGKQFILGFNGSTAYLLVYNNNQELLLKQSYSLSTLFGISTIFDCAIQLSLSQAETIELILACSYDSGKHGFKFRKAVYNITNNTFTLNSNTVSGEIAYKGFMHHNNRIIKDAVTPNIFYALIPDESIYATFIGCGAMRVNWNANGTGTVTYSLQQRINSNAMGWLPFQQTGYGDDIVLYNNMVHLDKKSMTLSVWGINAPAYFSHNMKYMVKGSTLYSINSSNVDQANNNKVTIKSLGVTPAGYVFFSSDDKYMVIPTANTLYVFRLDGTNTTIVQQLSVSLAECAYMFDSYNFLQRDSVGKMHLLFCVEGDKQTIALNYQDTNYINILDEYVPASSKVLSGTQYVGLGGNLVFGTMPNNGTKSFSPRETNITLPEGYYAGGTIYAPSFTSFSEYNTCLSITNNIIK